MKVMKEVAAIQGRVNFLRGSFLGGAVIAPLFVIAGTLALGACATVPEDAPVALHEAKTELDAADKLDTAAIFPKTIKTSETELDQAVTTFKAVPKDERASTDWAAHPSVSEALKVRDRVKKANSIRNEMNSLDGQLDSLEGDASITSLSAQVTKLQAKIAELEKEKSLAKSSVAAKSPFALLSEVPLHGPTVFFDTDKVEISERDKPALKELAKTIGSNAELKLNLVGYADPRGKATYNEKLSQKRAAAVRQFLIKQGLKDSQVSIQAMGSKAAFYKKNLAKLQLERRVEMLVTQR